MKQWWKKIWRKAKTRDVCKHASRPNQTDTCISDMPKPSVWIRHCTKYGGVCNLRFDDTNPVKEDLEYVDAIKEDIEWLGYHWNNIYYASDYFQQLWDFAIQLIKEGKAYIDEQTSEQIASQKGTPTQPGTNSPYRDRPIEENLELFHKMNSGELEEGSMVLRAKIDMANPNMHFRDPIIYVSSRLRTTVRATSGKHTRCTTLHTDRATSSKVSLTRCVHLNLSCIVRCTICSSTG